MPHFCLYLRNLLMSEQKSTFTHVPEIVLCPRGGHDSARRVGVVTQQKMADFMSYGVT